nr:CPXCG motif-containing cysteine-rich protein [Aestuariicella hydrocarbonica]
MIETRTMQCPYCGEPIELIIDRSVPQQRYIEDCQVCCRPITVDIDLDTPDRAPVQVFDENES